MYGRARLFNDAPPLSRDIADLDLVAFTPVWTADVEHALKARCDFPLAVTSNDEVNTLAALHFGEVFSVDDIYQLPTRTDGRTGLNIPQRLRARPLFADDATYLALSDRFDRGDTLRVIPVDATETLHTLVSDDPDEHTLPLFVVRGRRLLVVSTDDEPMLMPDDRVIVLTDTDLGEDATVAMGGTHGSASASDD
ncbi:MAG: hypothetical protein LCH53_09930 [Bacteroidetes bacterium]|nr:hypothetical protein [Bacteroidota bacterium]